MTNLSKQPRTLSRRTFVLGLTAAAPATALVTACGAGTSSDAGAPKPVAAPVTVTYMSNLPETHPEGEARLSLLNEFSTTNEQKITVNVE